MTLVSAVALIFQCGGGYLRSVLFKKKLYLKIIAFIKDN